jgi:hypothetical protein
MAETISISLNEVPLNDSPQPTRKSVNFGPGADLLMNPNKQKRESMASDIVLDDLTELNTISLDEPIREKKSVTTTKSNFLFSGTDFTNKPSDGNNIKLNVEPVDSPISSPVSGGILKGASQSKSSTQDEDGYKKFNDIPINPSLNVPMKKAMTNEEMLKEKFFYLRKLEEIEKKGVTLSKKYSMQSSLDEMKGEYEMIKSEKEKKASVKFQQKCLMACITGLEFLNNKFDPFDLKLDGWAESVNENVEEYDDVFGELHAKYASKAKIAPELKLLFMLGGSAVMIHMTNTMFKSSMPGMDDILKQNPELMQQFTQAAVNSMGESNPGFGNFMGSMMQDPPRGSPPGPSEEQRRSPPRMKSSYSDRPDVSNRRANFNDAENMESNFSNIRSPPKRPEMKGPTDLKDLLSGLKTKKINLKDDNRSTVSIQEIEELNSSLDGKKPKKSRRKISEKNVVNLSL